MLINIRQLNLTIKLYIAITQSNLTQVQAILLQGINFQFCYSWYGNNTTCSYLTPILLTQKDMAFIIEFLIFDFPFDKTYKNSIALELANFIVNKLINNKHWTLPDKTIATLVHINQFKEHLFMTIKSQSIEIKKQLLANAINPHKINLGQCTFEWVKFLYLGKKAVNIFSFKYSSSR